MWFTTPRRIARLSSRPQACVVPKLPSRCRRRVSSNYLGACPRRSSFSASYLARLCPGDTGNQSTMRGQAGEESNLAWGHGWYAPPVIVTQRPHCVYLNIASLTNRSMLHVAVRAAACPVPAADLNGSLLAENEPSAYGAFPLRPSALTPHRTGYEPSFLCVTGIILPSIIVID